MTPQSIQRVLVANRGEIALRIMRTCHEKGIDTVAIYGDGEEQASHVTCARDAYRIPDGEGLPYLRIPQIVEIARRAHADAIHPGYGFLAENAAFAQAVTDAGLLFIGPPADVISLMGDKVTARRVATEAGVDPVPGTTEPVDSVENAANWASRVGYPVAVKASGGGGGRGFRVATNADELPAAFEGSRGEASRYFANPDVYLEKYIPRPRHIEVQVLRDVQGNVVLFPERECSIQRRHQKLIEESPSTAVTPETRQRLHDAARRLVDAVGYEGVGTIEFLLDADGSFYFLEMNTRIQVEHTVTEMLTGIDIVREQIRVADGQPVSCEPGALPANGWAIECRINAEDAANDFRPQTGTLTRHDVPAGFGVRVDGSLMAGQAIHPAYDSMISKLITWGRDREEATARLVRALADYRIDGVQTTIPFHVNVLTSPAFVAGDTTTAFLTEHPEVLAVDATAQGASTSEEAAPDRTSLVVEVNGRRFDVAVVGGGLSAKPAARTARSKKGAGRLRSAGPASGDTVTAPSHGTIVRVLVENGQAVEAGQAVCVLEAMKMETELTAPRAGIVADLAIAAGASVAQGQLICRIASNNGSAA